MVTRSTLDPLEEARARVRLRYARAKEMRPLPGTIGKAASRIARAKIPEKGPAIGRLKLRWTEIVGEQLARISQPEKVGAGKNGRVLTLRVIPAAAGIVQHQSELIRQRVSVALGGDIREVRLVQGPLSSAPPMTPKKTYRPLTGDERETLMSTAARIEDPYLRQAIVALGEAVLSADKGSDTP